MQNWIFLLIFSVTDLHFPIEAVTINNNDNLNMINQIKDRRWNSIIHGHMTTFEKKSNMDFSFQ